MPAEKVRVLVVEDVLVVRKFLVQVLSADPKVEVIGAVEDGQAAVEFVTRTTPDVITMDITMPRLNGFEATRRIMESNPVPIVIVSGSYEPREVAKSFAAIEAGAVAILPRPEGLGTPPAAASAAEFVRTVKAMAEVRVVRRYARRATAAPVAASPSLVRADRPELIAIGASTGGPQALQQILGGLPADFPVPIVLVQHIAAGFAPGFVAWLDSTSPVKVELGLNGTELQGGHVYVAPDELQLGVVRGGRLALANAAPEHGLRPSVSYLFRSVAEVYGDRAVGVLLTGMGCDGAAELGQLQARGAVTLAQDQESSVVHGMPGAAIRLGAARYVLPPDRIAQTLLSLSLRRTETGS